MTRELAQRLKDAGYPQERGNYSDIDVYYTPDSIVVVDVDETVPEGSLRVPQYAELLMELTNLMAESGNTMHTQYNMDRGDFFVIMENKDRERLEIVRGTPLLDAMSEFYIKVKGRKK